MTFQKLIALWSLKQNQIKFLGPLFHYHVTCWEDAYFETMLMQMDSLKLNSPKYNVIHNTCIEQALAFSLLFLEYGAEKSLMHDQILNPYSWRCTHSRDTNSILQGVDE